jgi:hypothetical protein
MRPKWTLPVCLALATAVSGACSSGGGKGAAPKPGGAAAASSTTTTPGTVPAAYHPTIEPANFSPKITNPYFPLTPGTTHILEGTRDGKPQRAEVVVTNETKTIMGVPCLVIRDTVTSNGALVEVTTDWYAQAANGDVWYFGEDTKEYEDGVVTSTKGSWEAGVDGALPGIMMKSQPRPGDAYRQEYRPGEAEDEATVLRIDPEFKAPAGTFRDVVVTEDRNPLDPDTTDTKSFAPGVGLVYTKRIKSGHQEELFLAKTAKS